MDTDRTIAAVRRFNRFYTRRIGVLEDGFLDSPYTLAEVRVLYELNARPGVSARELEADLGLDPGYLSRILKRLRGRGLVAVDADPEDARRKRLSLTRSGAEAFGELDERQRGEVQALFGALPVPQQQRLTEAMGIIESLLGAEPAPLTIREHRPGDIGWVVQAHGEIYQQERGWGLAFETLVARVCADFLEGFDPTTDRCWIAERGGERVGSIMLMKHPERAGVGKLRLLLVTPSGRGLGVGARLVDTLLSFARASGYRIITLWTNAGLDSARRIYEAVGFRLIDSEPHDMFGMPLIGQTWELDLAGRT